MSPPIFRTMDDQTRDIFNRKHLEKRRKELPRAELAHVRAVQVLEGVRTAEARALLQRLAEGADGAPRTQDARAALRRLDRVRVPR